MGQPRGLAGRRALAAETDERLGALALEGDEAAFTAIVERYRAPLLRYCLGYLPAAAAEDALQQTFVSAYSVLMRGEGRPPVALKPWLYRVAHNAALNMRRDARPAVPLPEDLDGVERPDEIAQRNERLARVVHAVSALPSRQRQVIVRHELDGVSHERIAADLGLSPGAIRQLAHRARQTLRRAAAGMLPLPLLRRLAFDAASVDPAAATGGGGATAKVALAVAAVAVSGGAVEVSTHVAHHHRHAAVPRHVARQPDRATIGHSPVIVPRSSSPGPGDEGSRHESGESGRSSGHGGGGGPGPSSGDSGGGGGPGPSSGESGGGGPGPSSGESGGGGPGPSSGSTPGGPGPGSSDSGSGSSGSGSGSSGSG